tara:strand:- start:1975 stop:3753 length:1779 start_codon:yes stop_codon:yes gene_type:complete
MSNLNDTEIQRLFEEAQEKASVWDMPDDSRRASTDSIPIEFLEQLEQEEAAAAVNTASPNSETDDSKTSEPTTETTTENTDKQDEIMTQEDIEALITNSKAEKNVEVSSDISSDSTDNDEALSKSDIEEMFQEQSTAVSKPETENVGASANISNQNETGQDVTSEDITNEILSDNKTGQDVTSEDTVNEISSDNESDLESSSNNEKSDENTSEKPVQDENHAEDDLEKLIKKKKAEQQKAKSDLGEMDIAALFNNESNNETRNPSDPTSVLSQDDFAEKENIIDNESNVINSQNVLEGLLSKTQLDQKNLEDNNDGILSNEQVSEMLQSASQDLDETSKPESQPNNPFQGESHSNKTGEQFPAANEVEKKKNRNSLLKWILTFITGATAIASVLVFLPDIRTILAPKPQEFKSPAAAWSWEKNSNRKSSIKYKIFVPGMSLMLSSIDAGKSSDVNKLNSDMIKRAYELRLKQKKIRKFRMLNETHYLREAGDNLRMIHFDYALQTNDERSFIKKSVYLGVGDRLFKLDFTSRAETIDEPSDGPAWKKLEQNFRSALGLKEFKRDKEVYLGSSFENFKKASEYFATRAMGLNP